MNHQLDLTRLFTTIDVIVCSLWEFTDNTNAKYYITIGYIGNTIVLKLDGEGYDSIYRYELTSVREAKEKMEWIIAEKGLIVTFANYYYDTTTNMTIDFYIENQIQYSFKARNRSGKPIQLSYTVCSLGIEIDYQCLCERYNEFIIILKQNKLGLPITEISVNPNKLLRKSKLLDLLSD